MENSISPPSSGFARLWDSLVRPAASLNQDESRRVRLFSSILLVVVFVTVVATTYLMFTTPTPGADLATFLFPYLIIFGATAILFVAYLLTRTTYFSAGIWISLVVLLVDMPTLFWGLYNLNGTVLADSALLSFVAIPVVLASLAFTPRRTLLVGVAAVVMALSVPLSIPVYPATFANIPVIFVIMTTLLLALATYLRQQYTRQISQQVVQLSAAEHALQEANQMLEQRVADRTAALQQSESQYRAIVENNPDIITVADTNKMITFANVPEEVRASLVGRSLYDNLAPDQRPLIEQGFEQVKTSRENFSYELFGMNPWGQMGWSINRIVPIFEGDTFTGVTVISTDTTERKNSELALLLRNSAIESSTTGITISDATQPDMPLIYINQAFTDITGYTIEESLGLNCRFLQNDDRDQPGIQDIRAALKMGRGTDVEIRNYRKNGELFWNELRLAPIHNSQGEVTHYVGLSTDVTARKRLEGEREQLLSQTDVLYKTGRSLANATDEQAVVATLSEIPFVNNAASVLLSMFARDEQGAEVLETRGAWVAQGGYPVAIGARFPVGPEITAFWQAGSSDAILVENVNTDGTLPSPYRETLLRNRVQAMVTIPLRQGRNLFGILSIAWAQPHTFTSEEVAVFNALPALVSPVVNTIRLIRDLERTIGDLKVAKRIADENSRLKSEFLATMSHELRTPMHAIEGYTSIMLNSMGVEIAPKPRHMVERIGTNSKRLLSLINDFLDLSRIEAGRMEIQSTPIEMPVLVEGWRNEIQVLAQQKGLDLVIDVDPDFPALLFSDEEALSKVALNLLSNAIKFTHEGNVTLSIRTQNEAWTLSVSDTGIGIPPHAREYIFDEFRQVDGSSKREYGGTGLGLAIVQKLVRAMGGTITVTGDVGKGSTFIVTLPLHREEYSLIPT